MKNKEILAMVFPYGLFNKYLKFYDEFLKDYIFEIQDEIRIILIVTNLQAKQVLEDKFAGNKFEILLIPEAVDIWIRDWAPIPVKFGKGKIIYLKPNFTTGYYKGYYQSYIPKLKIASDKLSEYLGIKVIELPLNTDGGNFAFNGKDTIILTNRIISNNETLSIDEIRNIYKRTLGIKNVIFVPVEPGDITGHTDGTLRFIDYKTIIIGKYPKKYKEENMFAEELTKELGTQLGNNCKIIRIENEILDDGNGKSDILSASGNYINFLKINNKIFLPIYGTQSDEKAYYSLKTSVSRYDILKVKAKELIKISKAGGVLNCITWG
ncbi:MAG: agmatine deiminase family protein [Ignavibacteriae bacterium]|nr:agmatine deiminase family protein [Ignavibacteriota bacterium]